VLLIETTKGMRIALERAGLQVDVAANGKEAVQAINTHADAFCCVLPDMLLPTIHGS
jgi:CheY-like chemotaxis protein